MSKLQLRIFTSESPKVDEPVDMVIMRCISEDMGHTSIASDLGILPGHMPLSAILGISPLRILNEGKERVISVFGGIVHVKDNVITIMTEKAEWPEEIDLDRAKLDLDQAESDYTDIPNRKNRKILKQAKIRVDVGSPHQDV